MVKASKRIVSNQDELKLAFQQNFSRWDYARQTTLQQLGELLTQNNIVLGVPLESRIKTWTSIEEKLERKALDLKEVNELSDVVGVRAILLFRSDLSRAHELIHNTFDVVESENTGDRLNETQFGYQSQHYLVRLPKDWLAMPSLRGLGDIRIEIQVRTLAQHVWAAASHKLQYKHETSVPAPLVRTINRIAALLETVDLEFDRVLIERTAYEADIQLDEGKSTLNVDNLAALLDSLLPSANKKPGLEPYEDLLMDLNDLNIKQVSELKDIWEKHEVAAIERDRADVREKAKTQDFDGTSESRISQGVFRGHVGLARQALRLEYGSDKLNQIWAAKKKTSS